MGRPLSYGILAPTGRDHHLSHNLTKSLLLATGPRRSTTNVKRERLHRVLLKEEEKDSDVSQQQKQQQQTHK